MDFYPPGFLVADYADLQVTPADHSNLMAFGPKVGTPRSTLWLSG